MILYRKRTKGHLMEYENLYINYIRIHINEENDALFGFEMAKIDTE